MKKRKLISTILALLLALQFIVPAFASEGAIPPETGETVEEILPPEIPEEVLPEMPPEDPVPQEPGDTQTPDGIQEPEDDPQAPVDNPAPEDVPGDVQEPGGEPGLDDIQDPADAEEPPEASEPDAEPLEDLIDVLVPSTGQMVINPYRMKVKTLSGESREQIIHEPQVLISSSDFPVRVSARAVGKLAPESEARFVSASPAEDALDKEIFLYVEFQNDPAFWTGAYGDWSNQILVTDWGMEKENVMTLDAFGNGYFRLFGAMTGFPDVMWNEADAPDVTVAFTFVPLPEVEPELFPAENLPTEEEPWEETVIPEETETMNPEDPETAIPGYEETMVPEDPETIIPEYGGTMAPEDPETMIPEYGEAMVPEDPAAMILEDTEIYDGQ